MASCVQWTGLYALHMYAYVFKCTRSMNGNDNNYSSVFFHSLPLVCIKEWASLHVCIGYKWIKIQVEFLSLTPVLFVNQIW